MNIFKCGWYSVVRKPIKSIILVLILYSISSLLLISVGIYYQQSTVQQKMKDQVSGTLRLEINQEYLQKQIEEHPTNYSVEIQEGMYIGAEPPLFSTIFKEDIHKLSQIDGVSHYNIVSQMLAVTPVDFYNLKFDTVQSQDEQVNLQGSSNPALLDENIQKLITLEEGKWSDSSDLKENYQLVISKDLARRNKITVGDKLNFKWSDSAMDLELQALKRERYSPVSISGTVVGIFSVNRPINAPQNWSRLENTIYTNLDVLENVYGNFSPQYNYTLATFQVSKANKYEEVKNSLLKADINWERYELIDSNDTFDKLKNNFKVLEKMSTTFFWIILISGVLILCLFFIFWIRNRKHEVAILLSLGTEKRKIISQFIIEGIIVVIISFVFSGLTTSPISKSLDVQRLSTAFEQQENRDQPSESTMALGGENPLNTATQMFYEEATGEIAFSFPVLSLVFLTLILLVSISVLISMIPIMRMKPKEIFSKMN